jgi:Rrf2 family protein
MLSFSATTGYAVQALGCLSDTQDRFVMGRQISACTGIPGPYLAKVLNALVKAGLLEGRRGYRGGVKLTRAASEISLLEVADAVEGAGWLDHCFFGLTPCREGQPCRHPLAVSLTNQLREGLAAICVADLAGAGAGVTQRMKCCLPDGTVAPYEAHQNASPSEPCSCHCNPE